MGGFFIFPRISAHFGLGVSGGDVWHWDSPLSSFDKLRMKGGWLARLVCMVDVRHRVMVMRFYSSRLGLCCRRMGLPVLGIFVFPAIFRRFGMGRGGGVSLGLL